MKQLFIAVIAIVMLVAPAQAQDKSFGLQGKDFYAFETSETQKNGAIFGKLRSVKREDVEITSVIAPDVAESLELHTMSSKMGVMKMREVESFIVAPRGEFEFTPKGDHIMLMGLKKPLTAGDTLYIRLEDAEGLGIQIPVAVRKAGDIPEGSNEHKENKLPKGHAKRKEEPKEEAVSAEEASKEAQEEMADEAPAEESPAKDENTATEEAASDDEAVESFVKDVMENVEELPEAAPIEEASPTDFPAEEAPAQAPVKKKSFWERFKR